MRKIFVRELKRKIDDFRKLSKVDDNSRGIRISNTKSLVSILIGSRYIGKNSRAIQYAYELIKAQKIKSINHVCRINFDNPIFSSIKKEDLYSIQDIFLQKIDGADESSKLLFIFEEINKIPNWEEYILDISKNSNWQIIITGSSFKDLKINLNSALVDKVLYLEMYPLSFSEFLLIKNISITDNSTKGIAVRRNAFIEYLRWGGLPDVVEADESKKEKILHEYYNTMILKDIMVKHNISKPQQLMFLFDFLISNISKSYTIEKAYKQLKINNYSTSKDSIKDYIRMGQDSFFLFSVPVLSDSKKTIYRNYKKFYSIDWALANRNSSTWNGDYSFALENLVYLHLKRKYYRVKYYLTKTGHLEVDFACIGKNQKVMNLVQVSYNIDVDSFKTDIKALFVSAKHFSLDKCYIVTADNEFIIEKNNIKIYIIPAWKWLIDF